MVIQRDNILFFEISQSNTRTTSLKHFQDVRLISFQVPDNVQWSPGDVIMIRPKNSENSVNNLFKTFEENGLTFFRDTIVQLEAIYSGMC